MTTFLQYLALAALALGWWLLLSDAWRGLRSAWARRARRQRAEA